MSPAIPIPPAVRQVVLTALSKDPARRYQSAREMCDALTVQRTRFQPAPLPPLPRAAYHCSNPEGFFPSVEECNADWVAVGAH